MATKQDIWKQAIAAFEDSDHAALEFHCQRFLEVEPYSFLGRMLLVQAKLALKRFDDAAELLEGADPEEERALVLWHRTAGDYYSARGDYEAADDEYASALSLAERQTADLVLDLAEARINQGHGAQAIHAIDTYEAHHKLEDDDHELLVFAKARALVSLGRYAEALACAREALQLSSVDFPSARELIGQLEARVALEQAAADGEAAQPSE
ncbi:hypothetical protein PPSIR1_13580 [Plesiocystis pacifica SIR-1]|uniref:Uncharacterized protein n=1 Tax=Plesiocystis pacifica SIR-1 TaxID=391625 RepID=A6GF16_9BACT|nr:hypothetical protein [Plesiocystis pacifica]EDM75543.1 hypothetical protein PPSIR1_13580 [Plesiocystis pacifica SIR-1]